MIDLALLDTCAAQAGVSLKQEQLLQFDRYAALLCEWNQKMNLTAITEPDEIVHKHFADCLHALALLPQTPGISLIDVGTGAGFPGIAWLIARPDLQLTLLDSLQKRITFLQAVLAELDLKAKTVHARAEDAGRDAALREQFDCAAARAVAPLNVLSEYCLPFVRPGGVFVSLKGKTDEAPCAANAVSLLGGKIEKNVSFDLEGAGTRRVVLVRKISQTPTAYPRKPARITKAPL